MTIQQFDNDDININTSRNTRDRYKIVARVEFYIPTNSKDDARTAAIDYRTSSLQGLDC